MTIKIETNFNSIFVYKTRYGGAFNMKLNSIGFMLFALVQLNGANSFQIRFYPRTIYKKIRVECKLFVKRSYQDIRSDKSLILENFRAVITDDISNDLLYFLKFYHLTNDRDSTYFYIVFYECINLTFFKSNTRLKTLPISLSNIAIYIIIKNIILQQIIHHN